MTVWFEDFTVGAVARYGCYAVTREAVLAFATAYDPQPFHLSDEAAAANPIFGRLAASGWHTAAMTMRMTVERWAAMGGASLGSPGIDELRFLKPVYPGDTLTVEAEVLAARPLASRPDRGVVKTSTRTLNQHGEAVLSFTGNTFWPRRP
ncbi:MaoC family dehydratase [Sphingomonas solaris]|uniref:MaoC family dehydratase n=1 Tax=Alterirhizorhabdus solaris TaxID=2529389 RepID=A0A558R709_9SPHN|nr:MaoC family dehydratase [Sphingomonas solaris]TVV75169.1 MaoC family dehydratase [Sphingomonas solaris]